MGVPQLAMHSIREMCGVDDVALSYRHMLAFFEVGAGRGRDGQCWWGALWRGGGGVPSWAGVLCPAASF